MNADAFRHFYNYHFAENRKIWEHVASLSFEQFTQPVNYSHGSVRDQIIHLIDAEQTWFCELRYVMPLDPLPSTDSDDRDAILAYWDTVEQNIRAYLAELRDDMLFTKPIKYPEDDKDLIVWQVLLHVACHGSSRTTSQSVTRSGRRYEVSGLHFLRVRKSVVDLVRSPPRISSPMTSSCFSGMVG